MEELKEKPVNSGKKEQNKSEQDDLPKNMQDKSVDTSVRNMSDIIKEKMQQLEDLATGELMLDTGVRMKHRLESIKNMSSAKHIKVRGQWKTTPPKIHVSNLKGKKINNDEYEITFGVYETDEKGNKKLFYNYGEVETPEGNVRKKVLSADYKVAYEVKEIIKTGKPIKREVIRLDNGEN